MTGQREDTQVLASLAVVDRQLRRLTELTSQLRDEVRALRKKTEERA